MPIRSVPERDGRIYRKVSYGPLLDIFLIDMRSYRDSTWNRRDDGGENLHSRAGATCLAETRACRL
jgi:alkaline phosphatase D